MLSCGWGINCRQALADTVKAELSGLKELRPNSTRQPNAVKLLRVDVNAGIGPDDMI